MNEMQQVNPETAYRIIIGNAVYYRRKDRGSADGRRPLSLFKAAKEIGVSAATLSRVEVGRPVDIDTFRKICLWLEMSADELLGLKQQ